MGREEELKADLEVVKKAVQLLRSRFDTVQMICTYDSNVHEDTGSFSWGSGNWFALYGSVKEWLIKTEEEIRNGVRKPKE